MKFRVQIIVWFHLTVFLFLGAQPAAVLGDIEFPEVTGMIGLRPVSANSCVAIWVPVPEGKALSGVWWYNNDETAAFPQVLLESGTLNDPISLQDCHIVGNNIQGISSGWSELAFSAPVACHSDGVYLVFRFPAGLPYHSRGAAGGAAMGYVTDGTGHVGWISADGAEWVPFRGDFGFAIKPVFLNSSEATMIMKSRGDSELPGSGQLAKTVLYPAAPNPFNPTTDLKFSLARSGPVEVAVYNVRGQRVRTLAKGDWVAGSHVLTWEGRDDEGRGVSSGTYFVRMQAASVIMTQRITLVK